MYGGHSPDEDFMGNTTLEIIPITGPILHLSHASKTEAETWGWRVWILVIFWCCQYLIRSRTIVISEVEDTKESGL
jgi:hypothetical protein